MSHFAWPTQRLATVADLRLGKMLDKTKHRSGTALPYLRNVNVRWSHVDTSDLLEMWFRDDEIEKFSLRDGDVVVCEGGEPGRASVCVGLDPRIKFQKAIHRVRFTVPYEAQLFVYLLEHLAKTGRLETLCTGSTIKHLTGESFAELPIPMIPAATQRGLLSEVEIQFTRLDAGVAGLERVRANLKRYRAAVLKAACEGTLVPTEADLARAEGRDYETGDHLLERILTARRENWTGKGKYKTPAPPDTTGLPATPEGWTWATTEQLTSADRTITYGVVKLGPPVDGGVPVLRSSDVRHLRLDLQGVKTISPGIANTYARTFLKGGEIVITVRGTLGGVTVVPPECSGFNISREVAMLAPVLTDFIAAKATAIFIGAHTAQQWLLRRAKGIAYTGINIETLKELPLPLPPLAEQHRIVTEVERRLSIIDELDTLVETNLARAGRLRQSILAKAFSGELVPASGDGAASPPPRKKKGPPNGGPEGRPTAGKGPVQSSTSR